MSPGKGTVIEKKWLFRYIVNDCFRLATVVHLKINNKKRETTVRTILIALSSDLDGEHFIILI